MTAVEEMLKKESDRLKKAMRVKRRESRLKWVAVYHAIGGGATIRIEAT